MAKVRTVAIIQARMGSTRLPGKVLTDLHGVPLLQWLVERVKAAPSVDRIVVATGEGAENTVITDWVSNLNDPDIHSFVGSEHDVLERFYLAAKTHEADVIVRLTADDPLKDPQIIEEALEKLRCDGGYDYCSNTVEASYPEGLDVETFTIKALKCAFETATLPSEREHVTPFIWKRPDQFNSRQFHFERDLSHWRWTIDTAYDLQVMERVLAKYSGTRLVDYRELIAHVENTPELLALIQDRITERNEGYKISLDKEKDISSE